MMQNVGTSNAYYLRKLESFTRKDVGLWTEKGKHYVTLVNFNPQTCKIEKIKEKVEWLFRYHDLIDPIRDLDVEVEVFISSNKLYYLGVLKSKLNHAINSLTVSRK